MPTHFDDILGKLKPLKHGGKIGDRTGKTPKGETPGKDFGGKVAVAHGNKPKRLKHGGTVAYKDDSGKTVKPKKKSKGRLKKSIKDDLTSLRDGGTIEEKPKIRGPKSNRKFRPQKPGLAKKNG